jgi:hypothetical protein
MCLSISRLSKKAGLSGPNETQVVEDEEIPNSYGDAIEDYSDWKLGSNRGLISTTGAD